jgi:hypothetical protein
LTLRWDAPAGCPAAAEVVAQIRKLSGPLAAPAELRAEVVIRAAPGGAFQARIHTEAAGMSGSRVFEGRTCAALSEAVVVILALAADPYALTEPQPPPDGQPGEPRPALEPARAPRFTAAPEHPPATPVHLHVGLVAAGDLGTLAGATPGGGLFVAASRGPLRLELQGALWANRFVASSTAPGSGGVLGFASLAPRLCLGTQGSAASVGGCAGVDVLWAHGEGIGVARPAKDTTAWPALELGLWVRQASAGRLGAFAGLSAAVPLRRPEADITGLGAVYRPWAASGILTVGVDVRLF